MLHLYVKGLLYIEKQDIVRAVEQRRFCAKRSCVTNIKSSYNNIRPMPEGTLIQKDPLLGELTDDDWKLIQNAGFLIEGAIGKSQN